MIFLDLIQESILKQLASGEKITIQELHERIEISGEKVSIPNLYKIIRKLITSQILIKEGGLLSLHSRWIMAYLEFADILKKNYMEKGQYSVELQTGETVKFTANSLEEIDGLWGTLMIEVNRVHAPGCDTYVYQAHTYYMIGMQETEQNFFQEESKISKIYYVTGNDTFLDKHGLSFYTKMGIDAKIKKDIAFPKDGYCVTIIGDYIFELIYPPHISDYFRVLFESISSKSNLNTELFYKIFQMRAKYTLSIRRNEKMATTLRKEFIQQ